MSVPKMPTTLVAEQRRRGEGVHLHRRVATQEGS